MPRGSRFDPLNKRKEALDAGLPTFETGVACVNGHMCPRYTKSMLCIECKKTTFKKSYAKNKDRWLSYADAWRNKNRARVNEYASQYRQANVDKVRQTILLYVQKNKAKRCHLQQKRHATKLRACPSWLTKEQIDQIESIYSHAKYLSGKSGIKMVVDHIVPLQGKNVCGLHVPWNLQVVDAKTNSRKHATLTEAAYRPAGNGIMLSGKALPWNWSSDEHPVAN